MAEPKSQEADYGIRLKSGGTDAILAAFFREILLKLSIDFNRFQSLIDRYIITHGITSPNSNEMATTRSAYRNELMRRSMTWKVFVKGLLFLRVENATIELTLFHEDRGPSVHEFMFNVKEQDQDPSEEGSTLALFFREILEELKIKINDEKYNQLLDDYFKLFKPGSSPASVYSAKCSLTREFSKNSISWKLFIKGLIFLKSQRVHICLTLQHNNNLISIHKKSLTFI